jgi:hypothetical protein
MNDTANIKQLVPMPDKWVFHYLFRNGGGTDIVLQRTPILGLALIDYPLPGGDFQQLIVRFGEGSLGDGFILYDDHAWHTTRFLFPFFQNGPQYRALGFAPVGSPDDWFADDIAEATDQLEAEIIYGNKLCKLHHTIPVEDIERREQFRSGLDSYFEIASGTGRNRAGKKEFAQVFESIDKIREERGEQAVLNTILTAATYSWEQIADLREAAAA